MGAADPLWGQVVAVLRVIRGWNQRQLADAAGMSGGAISRYEEGGRPAPVCRLAAAMDFPPHLVERTLSFLRWARAAQASHLAAGSVALPGRIEIIAGELGLWLENVAREGLVLSAAPAPPPESATETPTVPRWWEKPNASSSRRQTSHHSRPTSPLSQTLLVLRVIRGWNRQQLAAAINVSEGTLANWERGTARPRIATLNRIVEAMDFPPAMLGRTLSFVQAAQSAREWHRTGGDRALQVQAAHLAARAAKLLEDFTRCTVADLVSAARLFESRRQAPALWERFRACTEAGQLDLAREAAEFHTPGFVEFLCEESRNAAGDSAARALHLARCAVAAAAAVTGSGGWRSRLEGYAGASLANALRVGGDLNQADLAMSRALELWHASAGDDPGLLNAARVLHLEASLRRDQRRLPEALALLEQALEIDRWGETEALLIGKARAVQELGQHEAAITLLLRAESQLDRKREPRNHFVLRTLLLLNLCHLGRHAEAELGLPELRVLSVRLGNQLDLLRVQWLRGKVAAGLGRTDQAIRALGRVRAAFVALDNAYDAAMVTLELAEIHAALGRTAEVKALAQESAPIFQAQGVHREARQALDLFGRAAEEERVTAELVRGLLSYLHRSRYDARARYGAAA